MKITSISLYSEENEIANFDFKDPTSCNPYVAETVLGLDADEITPKFYGFTKTTRKRMVQFSLKPREIVFKIILNPHRVVKETYSDLRDNLYKAISSIRTGEIDIRFNSGNPWFAYIKGQITKFESNLSSKEPSIQLTVYCEDPIIRGFSAAQFLADSSPTGLEPFIVVDTVSNAPHGCEIQITMNANMSDFSIIDSVAVSTDPDWEFKLVYDFETGDILNVNSQSGVKAVTVTRGVDVIPIANAITPDSVWPIIFPRTNEITFSSPEDITLDYLEFTPEFWGV